MTEFSQVFQTADWKLEKHVPVIECSSEIGSGQVFPVKVTIGKEVAHPNTTGHHICWFSLFFQPEGEKFPHQIGHFEFGAHGESTEGPDMSTVYTQYEAGTSMKTEKPGTLFAISLCNIHGLWRYEKEIKLKK